MTRLHAPLVFPALIPIGLFLGCSPAREEPIDPGPRPVPPQVVQPSAGQPAPAESAAPKSYGYEIVATYPHDPQAYTQGLLWHEGFLYESTGQWERSSLRQVDLVSGQVLKSVPVRLEPPIRYPFAEGLALVGDELFQLTWKDRLVYVWSLDGFRKLRELPLTGEGWGLTYDGERLILSDGTSKLRFFEPETFRQIGAVRVTQEGRPVDQINELEFIDGEVWANVWQEDIVLRIDPQNGHVTGVVDFTDLIDIEPVSPYAGAGPQNVLNGIAYDAEEDRLFVTGKEWPALFEVRVVER